MLYKMYDNFHNSIIKLLYKTTHLLNNVLHRTSNFLIKEIKFIMETDGLILKRIDENHGDVSIVRYNSNQFMNFDMTESSYKYIRDFSDILSFIKKSENIYTT